MAALAFAGLPAVVPTTAGPQPARLPGTLHTGPDSTLWVITTTLLTAVVDTPASLRCDRHLVLRTETAGPSADQRRCRPGQGRGPGTASAMPRPRIVNAVRAFR